MRARAASKTGLSLTVAPRAQLRESPDKSDHRRTRQVAWGALLVLYFVVSSLLSLAGRAETAQRTAGLVE